MSNIQKCINDCKVCDDKLHMCYNENGYTGTVNRLFMRQTDKDEQGVQEFSNGDVYQGEFLNNMMHGYGEYKYKNGNSIKGKFFKNNFTGDGIMEYKHENGTTICSSKSQNGIYDGQCQIKFYNGDIFEGTMKDKQMYQGRYKTADNIIFTGDISQQMPNGSGQYISSCCVAKGDFVDGMLTKGKITYNTPRYSVYYHGTLLQGVCDGYGKSKLFLNRRHKKLLKKMSGQFRNNIYIQQQSKNKNKRQ